MLPNNKKNAHHVSNVNGICNTGNSVFKLQIPTIGPNTITITISAMPKINLISADVITKIPPKDKLTNNLVLLCSQSTHGSPDL